MVSTDKSHQSVTTATINTITSTKRGTLRDSVFQPRCNDAATNTQAVTTREERKYLFSTGVKIALTKYVSHTNSLPTARSNRVYEVIKRRVELMRIATHNVITACIAHAIVIQFAFNWIGMATVTNVRATPII